MGLTSVPLLRDVTPASDSASIPEVLDEVLSRDVDQGLFVDVHGVEFVFRTRARRAPGRGDLDRVPDVVRSTGWGVTVLESRDFELKISSTALEAGRQGVARRGRPRARLSRAPSSRAHARALLGVSWAGPPRGRSARGVSV